MPLVPLVFHAFSATRYNFGYNRSRTVGKVAAKVETSVCTVRQYAQAFVYFCVLDKCLQCRHCVFLGGVNEGVKRHVRCLVACSHGDWVVRERVGECWVVQ